MTATPPMKVTVIVEDGDQTSTHTFHAVQDVEVVTTHDLDYDDLGTTSNAIRRDAIRRSITDRMGVELSFTATPMRMPGKPAEISRHELARSPALTTGESDPLL